MSADPEIRAAEPRDAARIAEIYNATIVGRVAFRDRPRDASYFPELVEKGGLVPIAELDRWVAGAGWLNEAAGYRDVGEHRRHGVLDGTWHDVVVVERSLG